jgi:hypothetical protein
MAKVFLLTQDNFDALLAAIDRDPTWGTQGGSSATMTQAERDIHDRAHRFFNYQVRTWIQKMQQ